MANGFSWRGGEGYDLHLLRDGPPSKSLAAALDFPPNAVAASLKFEPQFNSATPGHFGVTVDPGTGAVSATSPPPNTSRLEINNFLITASIRDTSNTTFSTEIRVHVHDTIKDLWLTPPALTIRKDSAGLRFTVLASFSDGVIGDITEWPQLTYQSRDPATANPSADVQIGPGGGLTAVTAGRAAEVTVTVPLPATLMGPLPLTSAPARVTTAISWLEAAATAKVTFVTASLRWKRQADPKKLGTVVPNPLDPNSAARNSVASVVANAANILIVAEGFSLEQEFNDTVNKIVHDLRTSPAFEPHKLLQDSVNFWSVFVPSQDDDITLLGTYGVDEALAVGALIPPVSMPQTSATTWSLQEMLHEVGLPTFEDPTSLADSAPLWTSRYGPKAYTSLASSSFSAWRSLAEKPNSRIALLDERDTAFGVRNFDRPRASPGFSGVMLGADPRRTKDVDTFRFIANLVYGGRKIGATWISGGKDQKRICFLCRTQKHAGINWGSHFFASTGRAEQIALKTRATLRNALSVGVDSRRLTDVEKLLVTAVVAHETGHSFNLGDEYGDGRGTFRNDNHPEANLSPKANIATTTTTAPNTIRTVYDKTAKLKWLWPRVIRGAFVGGKPQSTGMRFKVPLAKGHGRVFKFGDVVRFRLTPVADTPLNDAIYNFAPGLHLIITSSGDDEVELGLGHPGGILVHLDSAVSSSDTETWGQKLDHLFKPNLKYALVCPAPATIPGGPLLVADSILAHIAATHGPLNAQPGNTTGQETQVCVANYSGVMTATNIPTLARKPQTTADIIGIYEGGGGHDCGVFRPAGRCKMRNSFDAITPFCHVCRYIMVDTLDPTKHGELDVMYPTAAP